MLKVKFGHIKDEVFSPKSEFEYRYNKEWNKDKMVQDIILDIDKCVYMGEDLEEFYKHDILGVRHISQMSGGAKMLILMLKYPELSYKGSSMGENCFKWIERIASIQDITLAVTYTMELDPTKIKGGIINIETGEIYETEEDYFYSMLRSGVK